MSPPDYPKQPQCQTPAQCGGWKDCSLPQWPVASLIWPAEQRSAYPRRNSAKSFFVDWPCQDCITSLFMQHVGVQVGGESLGHALLIAYVDDVLIATSNGEDGESHPSCH